MKTVPLALLLLLRPFARAGYRPKVEMRHCEKLVRAKLTAFLMLMAITGLGAAGPLEDAADAYQRGDYATTLRLLRPLAEQGIARAQTLLGAMYGDGQGVPQDYVEAAKWVRKAADQGDAAAQGYLGTMYFMGRGVSQDYDEAARWFRKAADQGNARGQGLLIAPPK